MSEYNIIDEIDKSAKIMESHAQHILDLACQGCRAQDTNNKQWYLEQIIDSLGWSVRNVRGDEWQPGVEP